MEARKRGTFRRLIAALAALGVAGVAIAALTTAPAAAGQSELAGVRKATARFHSLGAATHAQYESFLSCFDSPDGGMGQHYVRLSDLDGTVDANHPEALVYQVNPTGLQLVAVEWVVPFDQWTGSAAPELFGKPFFANTTLGVWALHAWIWKPNPSGMFANYNPDVPPCP